MPVNNNNGNSGNPGILSRIRKIFSLNIGTVLFGVLLIYMIFSAILYLTSTRIESYQVIAGPLSRNATYTGLAVREETVYKAKSTGYVSYYAREGSKINANGIVYGISDTQEPQSDAELTPEELSQIRGEMLSFSKGFNSSKFNNTYSFKYGLEGSILQYEGVNNTDSSVLSVGNQDVTRAEIDGIVLYSTDGYEEKTVSDLTAADFDQNAYHETDLKTSGKISSGDDIYTLVTNEWWSLLIPLSSRDAADLSDRTSVRVKFLKDGMTQSGDFSIMEIDGQQYGKIDFNKGLIRYASDRFLEIELVTNTVTGLKIPLSAIVTKEFYKIPAEFATTNEDSQDTGFMVTSVNDDGNEVNTFVKATIYASVDDDSSKDENGDPAQIYYVDKEDFSEGDVIENQKDGSRYVINDVGVLEGVYCINQGFSVFRRIELLDQNEEYAVVSRGTSYGLSLYDHIVRNADEVDEAEILY